MFNHFVMSHVNFYERKTSTIFPKKFFFFFIGLLIYENNVVIRSLRPFIDSISLIILVLEYDFLEYFSKDSLLRSLSLLKKEKMYLFVLFMNNDTYVIGTL